MSTITRIPGGVCAARGFTANGIHCGIRKNKTKLEKRLRAQGAAVAAGITEMADELSEATDFVVRRKEFDLKPMSVEEAILQMNLIGHEFFVFQDDKSGETCVVYARRDGDYGLIVPGKKE